MRELYDSVSVVVPAHNSEQFISDSIQSVLSQSISPTEVIVVDDGSADGTSAVVQAFGESVRLIQTPNFGVSHARNIGLECATSRWIAFLDSDDTWEPNFLETFLRFASANPLAVLLFSDFRTFGQHSGQHYLGEAFRRWRRNYELLSPLVCIISSAFMVRKEATTRYPEWARNNEDTIYFNDVADEGPVVHVPELLANYRKHPSSAQRQPDSHERAMKNMFQHYMPNTRNRMRFGNTLVAYAKQRRASRSWNDFYTCCNLLEEHWADDRRIMLSVRAMRLSKLAYDFKDYLDRFRFSS
jgi:glycosyltransferase involved in cell wall biosynthesis